MESAVAMFLVAIFGAVSASSGLYYIGVGRADVTGPAGEVTMVRKESKLKYFEPLSDVAVTNC